MVSDHWKAMALVAGIVGLMAAGSACTEPAETGAEQATAESQEQPQEHRVVARGPQEGEIRWLGSTSAEDLGEGSLINIKVDRVSVPHTNMMVATQTLAASGIPVHLHTFEDEVIYVVSGHGAAIVGEDRQEVSLEPGSVLYIPMGQWHGLRNADPEERMEILIVTTPVEEGGLADFFRDAGVLPGHPPLNLSEEEFLGLLNEYGMEVPEESSSY